jgi:hypothetical protein
MNRVYDNTPYNLMNREYLFLISETNTYLAIIVKNQNVQKMGGMFSNCHSQLLINVAIFIKTICKLL